MNMFQLMKTSAVGFIGDEILTRGAAIAFYTVTSIGPLVLIIIGIAGMAYGQDAAQKAMVGQLAAVMGPDAPAFLEAILTSNSAHKGIVATSIGVLTLLVAVTSIFGEMQNTLNVIWGVQDRSKDATVSAFVKARAASAGLVAILGFLMIVSLSISAALTALGARLETALPFGYMVVYAVNTVISFGLFAILFAAIYKILPDRSLRWRDVALGALLTSALFTLGKGVIGWYLGTTGIGSSYGARRCAHAAPSMGILFCDDLPVWCGIHQSPAAARQLRAWRPSRKLKIA